ncbi:MAG: alkaline phosphatase family protein [Thiohalomonadaceae bacterium]
MPSPDYQQTSLVNLVAALRAAAGGDTRGCAPLPLPATVTGARHLILFIVDGLGEAMARAHGGLIARHLYQRLTSVFPTTTVSAITSCYTGLTPSRHGMTGWFTWLRELGSVATVLPFVPRHGGPSYTEAGITPADVMGCPSVFAGLRRPGHVVNPFYIADSAYSRALSGPAQRHAYRDLDGLVTMLATLARTPGLTYAYWPELDSAAHHSGVASTETLERLAAVERALEQLLDRLAGMNAAVLVTADHGMVDTRPDHVIDVAAHPPLTECLALPLCGEPRAAYAYVHADRREAFEAYVGEHLGGQCRLLSRTQLLEAGWLGPGPVHPELAHRIGDYLLLMKDDYVITQRLAGERPFSQRGVHGGLSPEELYVPLAVLVP